MNYALSLSSKPLNFIWGCFNAIERFHGLDFGEQRGGNIELVELHLQGLFVGVKSHFQKRESHGEDHPDVNHLDIRCGGQGARYADEAEIIVNCAMYMALKQPIDTYNVANTRRTVRLTMTTMSIYLCS